MFFMVHLYWTPRFLHKINSFGTKILKKKKKKKKLRLDETRGAN